uniref:Transposase n=1 Tax=Ditylenchus dipsaci TaxID=166011 RepID=A0A915DC10_9BILA
MKTNCLLFWIDSILFPRESIGGPGDVRPCNYLSSLSALSFLFVSIVADCWRAYDTLEELSFQLLRVNHSITFKTAEEEIPDCFPTHVRKAVHTNSIEASWAAVKRMIFRQPGSRTRRHLPGNLANDPFLKTIQLCVQMNLEYDSKHFDDAYQFNIDESSSEESEVEFTQHEYQSQYVVHSTSSVHSSSPFSVLCRDEVKLPFGKCKKDVPSCHYVEEDKFADDKCSVQFGDESIAVYKRNKSSLNQTYKLNF